LLDATSTGQLLVKGSDDTLGGFRRESQRATCATAALQGWPEQQIPFEVDLKAYYAMVAKVDVVDILAEAAKLLNE
jgi:hypothetical protein